jgi:hypothetical protein
VRSRWRLRSPLPTDPTHEQPLVLHDFRNRLSADKYSDDHDAPHQTDANSAFRTCFMSNSPLCGTSGSRVTLVSSRSFRAFSSTCANTSFATYIFTNCSLMILRNRFARDGKQPKLSWTVAIEVMPSATAELMSNSPKTPWPQQWLACPQRLLLSSQPHRRCRPSPCRSQDDMLQGEARAPSWTSRSGCGALASGSMRRHSARMR